MTDVELAERFEALRPRLLRLAYGQLGSLAEAEDVVQDAWLRLQRVDADEIRDLEGWLITTVSRLALDALRSARVRREAYVGPWLPEPIVSEPGPEERAAQRRGPQPRAARRARERSRLPSARRSCSTTCSATRSTRSPRTLGVTRRPPRASTRRGRGGRSRRAARASRRPASSSARSSSPSAWPRRRATWIALLAFLHPDVVLTSDGGGIVTAARKPLEGADRVARAMMALAAKGARASSGSSSTSTASPA